MADDPSLINALEPGQLAAATKRRYPRQTRLPLPFRQYRPPKAFEETSRSIRDYPGRV